MDGKILDSNIIIDYWRGKSYAISLIDELNNLIIPSIVIGELYFGLYKSGKKVTVNNQVQELVNNSIILAADIITAKHYGEIKAELKLKGRLIPENDIWIAAYALQYNMSLLTRDKHFSSINNLKLDEIN